MHIKLKPNSLIFSILMVTYRNTIFKEHCLPSKYMEHLVL